MKVRLCGLTAVFCLWAFPLVAASVSAVSNIGQAPDNYVLVGNNDQDIQVAVSFTTGPLATELASVTLRGSGIGGTSSFRVALYTGISNTGPSGILATLVGTASPGGFENFRYDVPAPIELAPNTTYWVVASAPSTVNPSGFSWQATSSQREDTGALSGWKIGDEYWVTKNEDTSWSSESSPIPQISVDVTTQPEAAPIITVQPTAVTPFVGSNVSLSAAATGNPGPVLQWRKDGVAIPGATRTSLVLVAGANNAGSYSVVASNSAGSATSRDLVVARPTFITPPASQRVVPGTTVNFTARVSSSFPLTYQWQKDGVLIPASQTAALTVPNVQPFSAGNYTLVATNIAGSTTSPAGTLSMLLYEAGRLKNISIRTNVGAAGQPLIVGVVIGGATTTGSKAVLMRGVGPSLGAFGVPGFLVDPTLSLSSGATVVASNDNWGGDAQVATVGSDLGAFPLAAATSRDAALYNPKLDAGSYTMQVAGVGGTTGVALAEIYDATAANVFFANTPRLINVSARTQVGTGGDILIAGFSIGGNTPQKLLIRAIGPTLGGFGVTGVLGDPKLDLYREGSFLLTNDNWGDLGGAPIIAPAAASVGAFPLAATSRDAALLVTLSPGSYTAQVSGVGDTTGVALIEIYEMP